MDYKDTVKIMLNQGLIKKQKVDFLTLKHFYLELRKI